MEIWIAIAIWYIGDKIYDEFQRMNDLKQDELEQKYGKRFKRI